MMRLLSHGALAMLTGVLFAGSALASPASDFEAKLRAAYADYRAALFLTNSGNQKGAADSIWKFQAKWADLTAAAAETPPQYADDEAFRKTLDAVSETAQKAAAEIDKGQTSEAHGTLEEIRGQIGDLHERNGIIAYSDRMNAYHAEMEAILGKDYDGLSRSGLVALHADAAVLVYLADQIATHPPAAVAADGYQPLLDAMMASARALLEASASGDAGAVKKALAGLKPPYSKLFLKFG